MMRRLALILITFGFSTVIWAGTESGADFLKIPIGARGVAMGQAYTALADQTDSLNWNVAGLAPANPATAVGRFTFSHQEMFLGNQLDHVSVTLPRGTSGFGFSITRMAYPRQEARDEDRNVTGSFGAEDLAAGVAFAATYGPVRLGTQVKMVQQKIANQSASGFAMDFGFQTRTPFERLNIGASVRNLGPSMQFVSEKYSLPLEVSLGGALHVTGPLIAAIDVQHRPYDGQTSVSLGTEFSATGSFALRAGYIARLVSAVPNNQQSETNRGVIGGLSGMNAGFGLKFSNFFLDYAMSPFGELGDIHSLTLSTSFGHATARNGSDNNSTDLSDPSGRSIVIFGDPKEESAPWWAPR